MNDTTTQTQAGFVVDPSPDLTGYCFDAPDGQAVVLDRDTPGGNMWRVHRGNDTIQPMRPATLLAAQTLRAPADQNEHQAARTTAVLCGRVQTYPFGSR